MRASQLIVACTKCGRPRSQVTYFYTYGGKREKRLRSVCKPCHIKRGAAVRRANRAQYNATARARRRSSLSALAYGIWKQAKDRARKRGLEFSIDRTFVEAALAIGRCAVTYIAFDLTEGATRSNPLAPSLDRIDPHIGYVPGNCRLVTWIYNRAKGDGTDADVHKLAEALLAINQREAA